MLQTYCGTRFCMLALFLLPSRSFPPPVFDHLQYAKTYTKARLAVCKNLKQKQRTCLIPMIPCMSLRMRLYEKLHSSA